MQHRFTVTFWARAAPGDHLQNDEGLWAPFISFVSSLAPPQELVTIKAYPGAVRLHYRPFDRCGPGYEEGIWLRIEGMTLPRDEWTRFSFWLDRGELGLMVSA